MNEYLKQGLGRLDNDSGSGFTRSALVSVEVALSDCSRHRRWTDAAQPLEPPGR